MTQEEKAKRYDEAIQRARQFIETPYLENSDDVVGYIFPELKESERIRKALIDYHKRGLKDSPWFTQELKHQEVLAWLENQGEQKPAWSEEDETGWTNTMIMIKECAANHYTKDSVKLVVDWLENLKNKVLPQQKKEWSEEDERNLNDAILFIETGTYSLDKDNLINWLKSLRPQNRWKPSDEQIEALDFAADCIVPDEFCFKRKVLKELLEQLKKLKG